MKSSKVLEMLNNNQIEELKAALQDEIFTESLKTKPDAKKRYAAMKKYFKMADSSREICQRPCEVDFDGEKYNSFTNTYSLALTKETCGEIPMFDTTTGNYPDISRLVDRTGLYGRVAFEKVIAEAKSKGYKLTKSSLMTNDYVMHLGNSYYRIGLIDVTYSIIADGKEATVYYNDGRFSKLTVENDIGICVIMPVRLEEGPDDNAVVIEVEE